MPDKKTLTLCIEDKCPSWNTIYAGIHWAKRKQMVDTIHELVQWEVYQIRNKPKLPFKKVKINATTYFKGNKRHDIDNLCLKPYIDGLVHAKVVRDDNYKIIPELNIKLINNSNKNIVKLELIEI